MRNLTASHQTKIKQLAKEESKIVDKIFYRYIHEGVLFRLVRSPHKDNLLLKGGTLVRFCMRFNNTSIVLLLI